MIRRFGLFWYDFVVGDDAWTAISVVAGLAVTAILAAAGAPAWWVLPVVAAVFLHVSLVRAVRVADRAGNRTTDRPSAPPAGPEVPR